MFDGGFVLSGEAAEPCGDFAVGQLVQARHVAVSTESRDAVWVASCVGGKLWVASCVGGKLCGWQAVCGKLCVWQAVFVGSVCAARLAACTAASDGGIPREGVQMEAARHSLDGVRGAPWQGLHVASAARGKGCTWQGLHVARARARAASPRARALARLHARFLRRFRRSRARR